MNPTAVKEAAKIRFPMDQFIGVWWSGGEDDARPAGEGAKGYKTWNFNAVGADFPALQDIKTHVVDKGLSKVSSPDKVGENLYNRGVMNSVLIAEAIRTAQQLTGKPAVTAEDVRRGLESLDIAEARLEELGLDGFMPPDQGHLRGPFRRACGLCPAVGRHDLAEGHRLVRADDRRGPADAGAGRGRVRQGQPAAGPSAPSPAAEARAASRRPWPRAALLEVNNIEVVYDHVILVLKGVSLDGAARRHRGPARRQRRRQDHDPEGHLQPAAGRARRGHPRQHRARRRAGAGAEPERAGPARLRPGHGGPALLRPPDDRGEPAHRRLHPQGRRAAAIRRDLELVYAYFPPAAGAAPHPGRLHLGRRAADVRDRPGADGAAAADPARRAVDGPGAAAGRGDLRDRGQAQPRGWRHLLLAEQNTNVALRYATYGYILESGRVVLDGARKRSRTTRT